MKISWCCCFGMREILGGRKALCTSRRAFNHVDLQGVNLSLLIFSLGLFFTKDISQTRLFRKKQLHYFKFLSHYYRAVNGEVLSLRKQMLTLSAAAWDIYSYIPTHSTPQVLFYWILFSHISLQRYTWPTQLFTHFNHTAKGSAVLWQHSWSGSRNSSLRLQSNPINYRCLSVLLHMIIKKSFDMSRGSRDSREFLAFKRPCDYW